MEMPAPIYGLHYADLIKRGRIEMTLNNAKDIAGDRTGFYPESLKLKAKKFIAENGSAEDKKMLQRSPQKNVVRLGDSKVQRIGAYNETDNTDTLANLF
jgi:hypothetical protein